MALVLVDMYWTLRGHPEVTQLAPPSGMMGAGGLASTMAPLLDPLDDDAPLELLGPPLDPPLDPAGAPLLLEAAPTPELEELPVGAPLLLLPVGAPLDPVGGTAEPLELLLPAPPSDLRGSPGSAAQARPRQVAAKPAKSARRGLP